MFYYLKHHLALKRDGFSSLRFQYLMFQFASGFTDLFGILFIFGLGQGLMRGLFYILLYFGGQRIFVALFSPLAAKIVSHFGYRLSVLVALMLFVTRLIFLIGIDGGGVYLNLFLAAIVGGFAIALYYLVFHSIFLEDNDDKRIGEQFGQIMALGGSAAILAPFISGFLVERYGFDIMFTVGVFLLLFSSVPLFFMRKHKRHGHGLEWNKTVTFIKKNKEVFLSLFFWSLTDGVQIFFWTVFYFLIVGDYATFGLLATLVGFANGFGVYFAGRLYDRRQARPMFLLMSGLVNITWVARFFAKTSIPALFSDFANRTVSPYWWGKIKRQEFKAGETFDSLLYGLAHEYVWTAGYLVALIIGFLLMAFSAGEWYSLLALVLPSTFLATYFLKDK